MPENPPRLSSESLAEIRRAVSGKTGEVRMACLNPGCTGSQDKTLSVNADSGKYQCFRCEVQGNIYHRDNPGNGGVKKPIPEYLWEKAEPCTQHPYLTKKGVKSYGLRIDQHGNLLIPLSQNGHISTIQFISPDGKKNLLSKKKGGHKKGSYFQVGSGSGKIAFVGEGYATMAAVYEATGAACFMAVDAGNLKPATENLRKAHPDKQFVFCADNDRGKNPKDPNDNAGYKKAAEAAWAVDGLVCIPEQPGYDFNDLYLERELDAVKTGINTAHPPPIQYCDTETIIRLAYLGQKGCAKLFHSAGYGVYCYDHTAGCWFRFTRHYWTLEDIGQPIADLDNVQAIFQRVEAELGGDTVLTAQKTKTTNDPPKKESLKQHLRTLEANQKTVSRIINHLNTLAYRKQVVEFAAQGGNSLGITGREWDLLPWKLACKNGVLDLKTGKLEAGKPGDFLKSVCPTAYRPDAQCPQFEHALRDIFNDNQELIDFFRRVIGMAIVGEPVEHKLIVLYGSGRNGKDTLLEIFKYVLGDLIAGAIQSEMLLDQGRIRSSGGPSADVMRLRGLRIAWASETNEGRRLDAGKIKLLTGGGELAGREPYARHVVSFPQSHTLFLLTNCKPHAPADDYALWKRLILIPFTQAFVEEPEKENERQADKELPGKLRAEAEGILAWMVRGCLEWQKDGLRSPAIVKQATQQYQNEEDLLFQFIEDACVVGPEYEAGASELYNHFVAWMKQNGMRPMSKTKFGRKMTERYDKLRKQHIWYYQGIGIISDD